MIMSQRYPDYFDGIISGDPAIRTGHFESRARIHDGDVRSGRAEGRQRQARSQEDLLRIRIAS